MTPEQVHKKIKIINGEKVIENYLDLSAKNLTSLEPLNLSDVIINGHFYCYGNPLTSLKGAPKQVNGNFYCFGIPLTTLEGLPESIGGKIHIGKRMLQRLYWTNHLVTLYDLQNKFKIF